MEREREREREIKNNIKPEIAKKKRRIRRVAACEILVLVKTRLQ
jgi:hypothetical protein